MITFHTPTGRAGSDQIGAMEESVNAHLEQMFMQRARKDILSYGVGRTTTEDSGSRLLEAQRREYDGQIVFHAGRALELSMQIVYARGVDRIMGREYPNVDRKVLDKDFKSHNLLDLYTRIINELGEPDLDKAFEHKYQEAIHKGVFSIYIADRLAAALYLQDHSPFTERSIGGLKDGEEHTMDHSTFRDLFVRPDGTSSFAQMPESTFTEFLKKADAVYYERDLPGREHRRNMRWGAYSARDHEIGRTYVTIGVYFFSRLVQGVIQLGKEPWVWHHDFLKRTIERHRYRISERMQTLAKQVLTDKVDWPEVISAEEMMEQWTSYKQQLPTIGKGNYDHLHTKFEVGLSESGK